MRRLLILGTLSVVLASFLLVKAQTEAQSGPPSCVDIIAQQIAIKNRPGYTFEKDELPYVQDLASKGWDKHCVKDGRALPNSPSYPPPDSEIKGAKP